MKKIVNFNELKIKTKIFSDNRQYFNFCKRDDIILHIVRFTKTGKIKVVYEEK